MNEVVISRQGFKVWLNGHEVMGVHDLFVSGHNTDYQEIRLTFYGTVEYDNSETVDADTSPRKLEAGNA